MPTEGCSAIMPCTSVKLGMQDLHILHHLTLHEIIFSIKYSVHTGEKTLNLISLRLLTHSYFVDQRLLEGSA